MLFIDLDFSPAVFNILIEAEKREVPIVTVPHVQKETFLGMVANF